MVNEKLITDLETYHSLLDIDNSKWAESLLDLGRRHIFKKNQMMLLLYGHFLGNMEMKRRLAALGCL